MDIDRDAPRKRRTTVFEELERLARAAVLMPLSLPILLLGGIALGKLAMGSLALSEQPADFTEPLPQFSEYQQLGHYMEGLRRDGVRAADYAIMYRDHVASVEETLRRHGVPDSTASEVAWPLVEHAYRQELDVALVAAILLLESRGRPDATSPVGARGLMQVMPGWLGHWRECGQDLYDIEDNLCHGTNILSWYLENSRGDERRALLGYNGCVNGTNTPDCFSYPDRVQRLQNEIRQEWEFLDGLAPVAASP